MAMGRPRKAKAPSGVDIGKLCFDMAKAGCPQGLIAKVAGCSVDTIQRNFSQQFDLGMAECEQSLRKKQIDMALAGNVTMLIWVGKQLLGQKDRMDVTDSATVAQQHADAIMRRKAERLARQAAEEKAIEAPN